MSVYVDNYRAPYGGMKMSHMMADTIDELHEMADAIGLKREWFQDKRRSHYDVSEGKRDLAIKKGAIEVTPRQMVKYFMDKEDDDICIISINDNNPGWKRFECQTGTEYPYHLDSWKFCPFCGRRVSIKPY